MSSNNPPTWLNKVFSELFAIRNSVQLIQQRLNTLDTTKRGASSDRSASEVKPRTARSSTPARPSRYRQLVDQIYNRPAKPKICWYHRTYGAAANPANCTDPSCTFVAPAKIHVKPTKKKPTTIIRPPTPLAINIPLAPLPPMAPWASPDSVKSDLINKIRTSKLSDSSSSSETESEDAVPNPKGE